MTGHVDTAQSGPGNVKKSPKRIAILGGGIAGVTAAWQLAKLRAAVLEHGEDRFEAVLFEASARLGGTVETVYRDGFTIECGPDGWVSEKPWARQLAEELGLQDELIFSNDAGRVTYLVNRGELVAMPDGMRMMVPSRLDTLVRSPLFSEEARRDYAAEPGRAAELLASAPQADESVADFVRRHFGEEVLAKIGAPLLSGVFGGDVERLSVQAVMPGFIRMEREHGSLIAAVQQSLGAHGERQPMPIFTSIMGGLEVLVHRLIAEIPADWIRLETCVTAVHPKRGGGWLVRAAGKTETFDAVLMALPPHVARPLLREFSEPMSRLLAMEASSAVVVALAFDETFELPQGFGFLVPAGEESTLLACTFVDQKFVGRVPRGARLLRGFFGGARGPEVAQQSDESIAARTYRELVKILGPLPTPAFHVVRRWPDSLPQYAVGHLERMAELERLARPHTDLLLLGNAYRGVGLPDLIRDARRAARDLLTSWSLLPR